MRLSTRQAQDRSWDAIVIGTGMGGGTVGWALATKGWRVLFIERGERIDSPPGEPAGNKLENGWWPEPMREVLQSGSFRDFHAPLGCGWGGSSIHYAAALERLAPSDFRALPTARENRSHWPVGYEEFVPYYEQAEHLYRLPPRESSQGEDGLSEWDRALMAAMRSNGFHPDRLRVAMRYDEQCEECIGRLCPRNCKADARSVCLDSALREANCGILESCTVVSIDADEHEVRRVVAIHQGEQVVLEARIIVLAAGAIHSPQLLLRSRNDAWPTGLANRSDQVGRNLMFHSVDLYAAWAPRRLDRSGRQKKSISVRDFYEHEGRRLGYVQSMGLEAGRGEIAVFLKERLRAHGIRHKFLLSALVKIPSVLGSVLFGRASIFAAMCEDDSDPENRILLDDGAPDGAVFRYAIAEDLRERAAELEKQFARAVKPWRVVKITPGLGLNHGHPCGTCRFGEDPTSSVLDRDCRAHGVSNLYVADASFMPRSGATNQSLTIAANALRVAQAIHGRLQRTRLLPSS